MANEQTTTKRSEALAEAGVKQSPSKATARELAQARQKIEGQIDDFMKKVGYSDPSERTDERGWRYFNLGSAEGRAGVVEAEGELYLRVEAPIMPLPSDRELILPLMRELLELNLTIAGEGRVGIANEAVFAAITCPVASLSDEDIGGYIHSVMTMADGLDDVLLKKYGGTSKKREGQG